MPKSTLLHNRMKKYAYRDVQEMYRDIPTTSDGLEIDQIDTMQGRYGENRLSGRRDDTLWYRLRRAFVNPFTIILFVLAIVSFVADVVIAADFSKNLTTPVIICVMILVSGAIRLVQELRAKNAAEKLNRLIHAEVTVKRSGSLVDIPAKQLVVGDLVLLSAGDRIGAALINPGKLFGRKKLLFLHKPCANCKVLFCTSVIVATIVPQGQTILVICPLPCGELDSLFAFNTSEDIAVEICKLFVRHI